MDERTWILRDGERELARLDEPVPREGGWTDYRVTPLGVPDLHAHLAEDPMAESRLTAVDADGEPAADVVLDRAVPLTTGRLRARIAAPEKKRGLWAVVFDWMSRV